MRNQGDIQWKKLVKIIIIVNLIKVLKVVKLIQVQGAHGRHEPLNLKINCIDMFCMARLEGRGLGTHTSTKPERSSGHRWG